MFGSTRAIIGGSNLAGSGALGALGMSFVAAQGWKEDEKVSHNNCSNYTMEYQRLFVHHSASLT